MPTMITRGRGTSRSHDTIALRCRAAADPAKHGVKTDTTTKLKKETKSLEEALGVDGWAFESIEVRAFDHGTCCISVLAKCMAVTSVPRLAWGPALHVPLEMATQIHMPRWRVENQTAACYRR